MLSDAWARNHLADVQVFGPNSTASRLQYVPWRKRPGSSMVQIICIGGGGGGGNGVVGANSTAGAGGGGGSSSITIVTMPAIFLPDLLTVSVGVGGATNTAGIPSSVNIFEDVTGSNVAVALANGGGAGGNAAGATAGTGGSAASGATAGTLIITGAFFNTIAGQAGSAGSANLAMPTTGITCMGGCGGGSLPAAAAVGRDGGTYTGTSDWRAPVAGIGGGTTTTPGGNGSSGYPPTAGLFFFFGGTGGGSSHGSATGAGLVGGNGGAGGGPGCGGGGGGGALTGSTQGIGGRGGDGIVYIIQW